MNDDQWVMTDEEILHFSTDFVDFSESKWGFYPGRHYNAALNRWFADDPRRPQPIRWQPFERRWMKEAFTVLPSGRPKYHTVIRIDIAKSGKTLFLAAVGDWAGKMVDFPGGEIIYAANSKDQVSKRAFSELTEGLKRHPFPYTTAINDNEVRYRSGNSARSIPLEARTQSGPDTVAILFDELWGYRTAEANKMFAEGKRSMTRNYSIKVVATYPGYSDDDGPLNKFIAAFFDIDGQPARGVTQIEGLEDLPCWRKGGTFLWWNHEPRWPWNTAEEMQNAREEFEAQPEEFARIWQAQVVSREDRMIDPRRLRGCEDATWHRLTERDRDVPMVIGLDIGTKHDSTACVARGFDPDTDRYPLYDYQIWVPGNYIGPADDPGHIIKLAGQWILDMHRRHKVLAVYYDDTQAALLASMLKRAGVNIVEVKQARGRERADMLYFDLLVGRVLRNFVEAYDLFDHILAAVARRTQAGFRIDKSKSNSLIDGCIADVFACLGVTELKERFRSLQKRSTIVGQSVSNVFNDIFGIRG